MVKATVLRVFISQNKVESDAKTKQADTPGDNMPSGGAQSCTDSGDDLATQMSETHIY